MELKQYTLTYNNNDFKIIIPFVNESERQLLIELETITGQHSTVDECISDLMQISPLFKLVTTAFFPPSYDERSVIISDTNMLFSDEKWLYGGLGYDQSVADAIRVINGNLYAPNNNYIDFNINNENTYGNCYDNNGNVISEHGNHHKFFNENVVRTGGGYINASVGFTYLYDDNGTINIGTLALRYIQPSSVYNWSGIHIPVRFESTDLYLINNVMPADYTDYDDPDDPYLYDSAEDTTDNQGTNDWTPDNITEKDLPTNFYGNSGLMKVFTPTISELNAFSRYLWNDGFNIDQFKKIVNNPFDLILGFQYLPLKVVKGGTTPINVGNILSVDTGLSMSYPTQENYKHSFGTLNLSHQEKKFLDYTPYCKMFIHLPYIGTQAIDADLIRRSSPVELIYKYNIVTGTIVAYLKGRIKEKSGVLYEWVGNCNNALPVANNDYSNTIGGMFSMISNAVSGAVFGGAIGGGVGASVGAISGAVSSLNVADTKPVITTQGSIGGMGACLNSSNDAFIITEQQRLSVATSPKGQKHLLGYPRNVSGQIKNSHGYNNIKAIRMSSDIATQEERQEITDILTQGYIYGTVGGSVTPKPSKPTSDKVAFTLYQNHSSNNRIDKSITHLHTYDCIFKDSTSIINPVIRIKAGDTNVLKGNYGYIPKFNRFYYVNNVTSINGDIWEISLHCDVLMSFRDDIIERNVLFNHSESNYNLYLNDGTLQMDSRPKITWDKFPNSLTDEGTYVLLLAGA